MIKTTAMLLEELNSYASPKTKLARMVKQGECFQIIRGLYETNRNVSPYVLAGSIYGPSYISFEYALSYHGLIPEAVYTVTSACFDKKKKKVYDTPFGRFTYRDVPAEAFPLYLEIRNDGEYWYRIASAEKALCDMIYTMGPAKNVAELSNMLFEDLRIENDEVKKLRRDVVADLVGKYHSTNVKKLYTLLGRL